MRPPPDIPRESGDPDIGALKSDASCRLDVSADWIPACAGNLGEDLMTRLLITPHPEGRVGLGPQSTNWTKSGRASKDQTIGQNPLAPPILQNRQIPGITGGGEVAEWLKALPC